MEPWSTLGHWVQPRGPEKVVKEGLTTELGLKGRPVRLVRTVTPTEMVDLWTKKMEQTDEPTNPTK